MQEPRVLHPSTEDKKAIVQEWLERFGFSYQDADSGEHYAWGLDVASNVQIASSLDFGVGWLPQFGLLRVQCSFEITEATRIAFGMMGVANQVAFMSDLQSFLLGRSLESVLVATSKKDSGKEVAETGGEDDSRGQGPRGVVVLSSLVVDRPIHSGDFFTLCRHVTMATEAVSHMFNKMGVLRQWR